MKKDVVKDVMTKEKKNMPIGVDDFAELIQKNYYFVDKTGFIREIMDRQGKVTLITRPRRFGKTLGLSLLEYFFSLENAAENRELFRGLAIEQAGEKYMSEQGTRPVILLTFKDIKERKWSDMLDMLSELFSALYGNFQYVLDNSDISPKNKNDFLMILQGTTKVSKLKLALFTLTQCLYEYYRKKPVLLLDEYDTPVISAWEHHYYDECIQFYRGLYGAALKNNDYLDFAVLTGITRVSKESIFSGLNNLLVCGVLSDMYADKFGFTVQEAEKLMKDSASADKMTDLRAWYDGYIFGGQEIYNPWSVINFVGNNCKFQPYWINVSENAILRDMLQNVDSRRRRELESLLNGDTVEAVINENVVYADLDGDRDTLFTMLLHTGYLKAVAMHRRPDDIQTVSLKIPNREIRQAYKQEILRYVVPKQGISLLQEMLSAMMGGRTVEFEEALSQVLLDTVSYHDTAQPENFYHGLLLGLSVYLGDVYRVESNRESGYGRFDIAFFPQNKGQTGVILEIKAAKTEDEMQESARAALRQIKDKAYLTALTNQGVTKIWQYGVAFCGKKVVIEAG